MKSQEYLETQSPDQLCNTALDLILSGRKTADVAQEFRLITDLISVKSLGCSKELRSEALSFSLNYTQKKRACREWLHLHEEIIPALQGIIAKYGFIGMLSIDDCEGILNDSVVAKDPLLAQMLCRHCEYEGFNLAHNIDMPSEMVRARFVESNRWYKLVERIKSLDSC